MIKSAFHKKTSILLIIIFSISTSLISAKPNKDKQKVFDYWTPERIASAIPRQLVQDKNGNGYIKMPNGDLKPHGHNKLTQLNSSSKKPMAKPGGGGGNNDSTPPAVTVIEPLDGATVSGTVRFAADVTDAGGVRTVTAVVNLPSGSTQTFAMSNSGGDTWETQLSGFTDGSGWSWQVEAKDNAKRGGNVTLTAPLNFTVDTGGSGGGGGGGGGTGGDEVANSPWTDGGVVQYAAGRLLYEMPASRNLRRWNAYVCSGTVTTDSATGRSIIITAAHCVYDDAYKAFARNVIFIPNQDGTTGSGTDSNCSNDPIGCWAPSFGVVDTDWTTRTFPANIPWDYAYYVVDDTGAHSGNSSSSDALDQAVTSMGVDFSTPNSDSGTTAADSDYTHGLGYSYSDDPNFMYCADNLENFDSANWWIAPCGLSGGSSGGPWVQPMDASGNGPIISVNSWGYTDGSPGMAGPKLSGTSASCLFDEAKFTDFLSVPSSSGDAGVASSCN